MALSRKHGLETESIRPREALELAESEALDALHLLRQYKNLLRGSEGKVSVENAIRIAEAIVRLAHSGRNADAGHAYEAVVLIDEFFDQLHAEFDRMFVSTK